MSLSTIDQSTGNATVISGNVNDKVGNLAALTTTDKSSAVGAINEVRSGLVGKNEVLTIAANTYQTNQQALQALYTAYNALNYDTKIRCYIKANDYYIFKISSINYGQFYRSYLVKSGNNFGIGFELLALANEEYLQGDIYDGASAGVSDLTTRAQTNKWALYY